MSYLDKMQNGCFTGDCLIKMSNGTEKKVSDIKKDDIVQGGFNVKAIIITPVNKEVEMVVFTRGLKITPWHPIIKNGVWSFPSNLFEAKKEPCDELYTILLDTYFNFNLNGSWVIGIGHNYKVGILSHNYFGSQKIVNDLMSQSDWANGMVTINSSQFVRDYITHNIIGISFDVPKSIPNPFILENKLNYQLINV